LEIQPQRALDGQFDETKLTIIENFGTDPRVFLAVDRNRAGVSVLEGSVELSDLVNMRVGEFVALVAKALFHLLEMPRTLDQLPLAAPVLRFAVSDQPQISVNARIVEKLIRQRDDGVEPIVLDDPTADIAFAGAGITGEQRRPVKDNGNL